MTYKVILHRMPYKPNTEWTHVNKARAQRQADALCELHSCRIEFALLSDTFHVFANEYYRPAETAKRLLLSVL